MEDRSLEEMYIKNELARAGPTGGVLNILEILPESRNPAKLMKRRFTPALNRFVFLSWVRRAPGPQGHVKTLSYFVNVTIGLAPCTRFLDNGFVPKLNENA